jgi:hypothetical protein
MDKRQNFVHMTQVFNTCCQSAFQKHGVHFQNPALSEVPTPPTAHKIPKNSTGFLLSYRTKVISLSCPSLFFWFLV